MMPKSNWTGSGRAETFTFPSSSIPSPIIPPSVFLQQYLQLAEAILPEGWEKSRRWATHPIAKRVSTVRQLVSSSATFRLPEDEHLLPLLGEIMLDSLALVHSSGGDATRLTPGISPGFGDPEKAVVFRNLARNPDQYQDVLVEMLVGAWHRDQGHVVRGMERGKQPDLRVLIPGADRELLVECKRLRVPSITRLTKELREVNKRLRTERHIAMTTAVFHLSVPLQRNLEPELVHPLCIELGREILEMYARNTLDGIDCVILSWDDYLIWQGLGSPSHILTLRRQARGVLAHDRKVPWLRPYGGHNVSVNLTYHGT